MAHDPRAVTGTVLLGLLVGLGAMVRSPPAPVADRVVHLEGEGIRAGWYEADALGPAVAEAGGVARYTTSPVADGDRVALVGNTLVGLTPPPPVQTDAWIPGKLRLNAATLAELESLPRVGPVLAARIVAGRPYRSLADLDRVKGIGPATLARLRPLVAP